MRRLWFALGLAVLGWDALAPHIESPSPGLAVVALLASAVLLARREAQAATLSRAVALALLAAAAITARTLPWPENLGALVLAAGTALALVPRLGTFLGGVFVRVPLRLGALLTALAALSHVYRIAEAKLHDLDFLARPLALAYRALGVHAAADPPFVSWQGVGALQTLDASIEKFIGHGLALFLVGGVGMLWALHGSALRWRSVASFLVLAAGFAGARFLALGLTLDQVTQPFIFYQRAWIFATLVPFAVLAAVFVPPDRAGRTEPSRTAPRLALAPLPVAATALLGILTALAIGFHDPGRARPGRILIDEKHSNWEWSTIALDTESYGVQTVYNYSELVRYLRHYYDIEANFESLDDSLLATCQVLILKTPTRPYSDDEVGAVLRFVERGGGLWLIGDHTNVFGMSTNLNKVARPFGIRFRFDAVVDLMTYGRQLYEHPRLFAHPSVRHVPPLLMATSSSLEAPWLASRVMLGRSLLSDELDYSVNSFFGDFRPQPSEPFGSMLQSVAVTRGRGRILVWSDSTIFSNFFMFIRGKPELALGSVNWLMSANRAAWAHRFFWAAAVIAALACVILSLRFHPMTLVAGGLVAALPAFALTARGLDAWVEGWSRLPEPRTPLPLVAFERGRTAYGVPDIAELPEKSPHSFHTFYVWTQRVGLVPATRLFEDCLENSDMIVLVNPREHFSAEELGSLQNYVRGGKGLLVLDSPHARHSTANSILQSFGMSFDYAEVESVLVHAPSSGDSLLLRHTGSVHGGEALLLRPDGQAALALVQSGAGRVVALCASDDFSDAVLGTTSEVPNPEQLGLYRLQFRIFGDLLHVDRGGSTSGAAADGDAPPAAGSPP